MRKRQLDVVVISDIHLGTYGCHAEDLLIYLSSIKPKKLILNGNIVDIWQFRKQCFPASHLRVIKKLLSMASNGTEIIYITGNHDEELRRIRNSAIANLKIVDELLLNLDGKRTWIFHGDVFDSSMKHVKWLAKLGSHGYNLLLVLNRFMNWCLHTLGKEKYSLSKKIKNRVKRAVSYLNEFESTVADVAIKKEIDTVICGHIHHPKKAVLENKKGHCLYLNSGDWIENLTALEYSFKRWKVYNFNKDKLTAFYTD
ncbi:MAG: UDP-2,3-diacylglucosamine diphosphatase, partial [Muriicola sp.]|nr:UDP-2,3-diacylglucosamine diphosphatase [Muriicola sp.]